jgi:hypothetical protein
MCNNRSGVSKFGDEHSFILSKNYALLQYRLLFQTATPPTFICFGRLHIVGAILRRDISIHLDAVLKLSHFQSVFTVPV